MSSYLLQNKFAIKWSKYIYSGILKGEFEWCIISCQLHTVYQRNYNVTLYVICLFLFIYNNVCNLRHFYYLNVYYSLYLKDKICLTFLKMFLLPSKIC